MRSAFRVAAVSVLVAAASFVIRADSTPPSQASEIQLQLGDLLFAEGKFVDALDAYQHSLKSADADSVRRPRMGVIASALRVAEFDLALVEARKLYQAFTPKDPDSMTLCGDARAPGPPACSTRPRGLYRDVRWRRCRTSRAGITGWRGRSPRAAALDEAMNEAQAALTLAPRDLEVHHTVGTIYERMHKLRGGGGRLLELHQPPAEQGSQREGRLVARGGPIPAFVRPARAVRGRARLGRQAVRRRFPPGEREGRRAREGQRRRRAGLRRGYRLREHGHHADHGAEAGDYAGHLYVECGRRARRAARPAARAHRLTRARVAEAPERAVPDQESAAAGHPGEGDRGPVTDRARLLDGHRLQDAQADVRQAPGRRAQGFRAADARPSPRDGAGGRWTATR